MKQVSLDGELEIVDTAQYFPKIQRKDFTVALNFQTAGPDPDPIVHLFYGCGSGLNWDGYCNAEVDKMIEQQSREADFDRRKRLLWTIERKLAEDNARPIIYYRPGGTCLQPYLKGLTTDVNYIFGSWRKRAVRAGVRAGRAARPPSDRHAGAVEIGDRYSSRLWGTVFNIAPTLAR